MRTRIKFGLLMMPRAGMPVLKKVQLLLLLLLLAGICSVSFAQQGCDSQYEIFCGTDKNPQLGRMVACIGKHWDEFAPECQEGVTPALEGYHQLAAACGADYKKLCGLNLTKLTPQTKYGAALRECLVKKWGEFSEGCKEKFRKEPFFSAMEPMLEAAAQQERKKRHKWFRIKGSGKRVESEYIEGDVIWYKAEKKKKKVLEHYDICPPVERGSGLRYEYNGNRDKCYYTVSAQWKDDFINEVKAAGYLDMITNFGITRRREIDEYAGITAIVQKYDGYCPDEFEVDLVNYPDSRGQVVRCWLKQRFQCKEGFTEASSKADGCMKLARCEESTDGYESIGDKYDCGMCYAGGCIDHDKSYEEGEPLCRVNYKNADETHCAPYRYKRGYYDNGTLQYEARYKIHFLMEERRYDKHGEMYWIRKVDHTNEWNAKSYDGQGRLRIEKSLGKRIFYDKEGNIIDVNKLRVEKEPDLDTGKSVYYRLEVNERGQPVKRYHWWTLFLEKEWVYDNAGNLLKVIDYDEQGNVIKINRENKP